MCFLVPLSYRTYYVCFFFAVFPFLACLYRISKSIWELLLVGGNLIVNSQSTSGELRFLASSCT